MQRKKHVRQVSLARVAKIMGRTCLKETYIISSYSRSYRIKEQEETQKDAVYFQSEDNHETIRAKTGNVLRNYRFKHELTMTFLFNIYAKQRRLKRWGENDGASSHTWQLQEKIYEKPIRFWRLDLLIHCCHLYTLQSTVDV